MRIPDDFEELQRRIRSSDRLRALKRSAVWWIAGILVLLIASFSSWYTVAQEGRAVVKRFGRVVDITEPGLHFKLPFGIDQVWFVPTERVLKEEFGFRTRQAGVRTSYDDKSKYAPESLMLTGDLNVVDVEWVVQYRIRDPERWLHAVLDQRGTIRDVAESVMRRIVGNRLGSDVLTVGRVEIAAKCQEEMQGILDSYDMGVHVGSVELQDVTPPDPVKPAFDKVNESRQEKEQLVNVAEKKRNQVIPRAHGEAQQTISEAKAYSAERVNRAKGEAARYQAILAEYEKAKDVTRRRLYIEMLDDVLPNIQSLYVIDSKTGGPLPLLDLNRAMPKGESK